MDTPTPTTTTTTTTDTDTLSALLLRAAQASAARLAEREATDKAAAIEDLRALCAEAIGAWGEEIAQVESQWWVDALEKLATTTNLYEAKTYAGTVLEALGNPRNLRAWAANPGVTVQQVHPWNPHAVTSAPAGYCRLGRAEHRETLEAGEKLSKHPITRSVWQREVEPALELARQKNAEREAEAQERVAQQKAKAEAETEAKAVAEKRRTETMGLVVNAFGDDVLKAGWMENVILRAEPVDLLWRQVFDIGKIGALDTGFVSTTDDVLGDEERVTDVERVSTEAYRTLASAKAELSKQVKEVIKRLNDEAKLGLSLSLVFAGCAAVPSPLAQVEPAWELERIEWKQAKWDDEGCRVVSKAYTALATVEIGGIVLKARLRLS